MNVSLHPSAALIDHLLPSGRAGADPLIIACNRKTTWHDTNNKVSCQLRTLPNLFEHQERWIHFQSSAIASRTNILCGGGRPLKAQLPHLFGPYARLDFAVRGPFALCSAVSLQSSLLRRSVRNS